MRFFLAVLGAVFIGANALPTSSPLPTSAVTHAATNAATNAVTKAHEHAVTKAATPAHHDHTIPNTTPSTSDQHLGRQIAELLVIRGQHIIKRAEDQIAEIVKLGGDNLVFTLKNEVALAEQLVTSIRKDLAEQKHIDVHKLHEFEEQLLHVENRLADELRIIEEIKKHPEQHIKVELLLERAERLEKEAKIVLHRFGEHSNHKIGNAIHNELHALNELAEELRKHPKGTELLKEAVQLAKHEATLRLLLDKAEEELKHHHHH